MYRKGKTNYYICMENGTKNANIKRKGLVDKGK